MSLLDFDEHYKPPFTAHRKEPEKDNFKDLQNLGHKEVQEDFSDMMGRV